MPSLAPGRNYVSAARNSNVAVAFSTAMNASAPAALRVFGAQTGQRAGTIVSTRATPENVALGDINGDGNLDLVTTNGDYLYVFGNNGSGTFTQLVSYTNSASFRPESDFVQNVTRG